MAGPAENLLPPNQAALKHGIWPFIRSRILYCDQCMIHRLMGPCPEYWEGRECVFLEKRGRELRDQLLGLPAVSDEDRELVSEYIFATQLIELIQTVLAGVGPLVEKKGEVTLHPLLADHYLKWSKRRQALGAELGIGALARKRLGAAGKPMGTMTRAIMALDEERREGNNGD